MPKYTVLIDMKWSKELTIDAPNANIARKMAWVKFIATNATKKLFRLTSNRQL